MRFKNYFLNTINILKITTNISKKELAVKLEKQNVPQEYSKYFALLIPLVFCRLICKQLNISFNDEYEIHNGEMKIEKGRFSENELYNFIHLESEKFLSRNINNDLISKVAQKSPEFELVNNFLLQGVDVSKIVFSPVHLVL